MITTNGRVIIDGKMLVVERLHGNLSPERLGAGAQHVGSILRSSFPKKVWSALSAENVGVAKIMPQAMQERAIAAPTRSAQYHLGSFGLNPMGDEKYAVFARIERYDPRSFFRQSYPNITDLETRSGQVAGEHEKLAAATLHVALSDFWPNDSHAIADTAVSAYTEADSPDISWYKSLGFAQTKLRPTEVVAGSVVTYQQLRAVSLLSVCRELTSAYPSLNPLHGY